MENTLSVSRINICLPSPLLAELKRYLPPRNLSRFLLAAARDRLLTLKKEQALTRLMSAPATFTDIKDSKNYISKLRQTDKTRLKRLGL